MPDRKKTSQRNHSTRFLKSPIQHPRHKLEYLCFRGCLNLGAYRACPKMQTNVFLYSPVSFVFLLSLAMSLPIITLPLNNFFRFFPVRTSHLNETGTNTSAQSTCGTSSILPFLLSPQAYQAFHSKA